MLTMKQQSEQHDPWQWFNNVLHLTRQK